MSLDNLRELLNQSKSDPDVIINEFEQVGQDLGLDMELKPMRYGFQLEVNHGGDSSLRDRIMYVADMENVPAEEQSNIAQLYFYDRQDAERFLDALRIQYAG